MLHILKLLPFVLTIATQTTTSVAQQADRVSPMIPLNKLTTVIPIRDNRYGERNVSYFTTDDGLAIIDGDVIYGTVNQLRTNDLRGPAPNNGDDRDLDTRALSLWASTNGLWPNAELRFKYDSAATETLLSGIVNAAITRWRNGAPWLTFTQVPNSATGENGVVMIRAPVCGGCNANVGWQNAPLTMNLQQACPQAPGTCGVAEAVHEFGHLLGFYHEHQRHDREGTVHYNCANLDPACPAGVNMPAGRTCCDSNVPNGCCTRRSNFNIVSGTSIDSAGAYDIGSIMQYRANAFAIPGTNTLTPAAPGVVVPVNNPSVISTRDFNRLCKMYRGTCPAGRACFRAGCPTSCAIIRQCNNQVLCSSEFAPPCCDPEAANIACQEQRALCATMDCAFMGQ